MKFTHLRQSLTYTIDQELQLCWRVFPQLIEWLDNPFQLSLVVLRRIAGPEVSGGHSRMLTQQVDPEQFQPYRSKLFLLYQRIDKSSQQVPEVLDLSRGRRDPVDWQCELEG